MGQGSAGEVALAGAQWLGIAVLHATGIRGAVQAGIALAKGAYRLAGGSLRLAGQADDEWVRLYRAVEPNELADIEQTRRLRVLPWQEVKYFSLTPEGAARYARMAGTQGKGPFTLVRVSVRRQLLEKFDILEVDQGIPTVVVSKEFLPLLGRPRILPFMPLVPIR